MSRILGQFITGAAVAALAIGLTSNAALADLDRENNLEKRRD